MKVILANDKDGLLIHRDDLTRLIQESLAEDSASESVEFLSLVYSKVSPCCKYNNRLEPVKLPANEVKDYFSIWRDKKIRTHKRIVDFFISEECFEEYEVCEVEFEWDDWEIEDSRDFKYFERCAYVGKKIQYVDGTMGSPLSRRIRRSR